MDEIETSTKKCITFRPKTYKDYDYITIQNGTGCGSYLGRVGGNQYVTLLNGECEYLERLVLKVSDLNFYTKQILLAWQKE